MMSLPILILKELGLKGALDLIGEITNAIYNAVNNDRYETPAEARADAQNARDKLSAAEKAIADALGE